MKIPAHRGEQAALDQAHQGHMQELERWARMPRKLVLDAKGEPIGSVPVERL